MILKSFSSSLFVSRSICLPTSYKTVKIAMLVFPAPVGAAINMFPSECKAESNTIVYILFKVGNLLNAGYYHFSKSLILNNFYLSKGIAFIIADLSSNLIASSSSYLIKLGHYFLSVKSDSSL